MAKAKEAAVRPYPRVSVDCSKGGRTRQEFKAECDVNRIVASFTKTGVLPFGGLQGLFADVSEVGDYREHLEAVQAAESLFMGLPAAVRQKFDNDPGSFVEFAGNPANAEELAKLLPEKKKPTSGIPAEVQQEAPKAASDSETAEKE